MFKIMILIVSLSMAANAQAAGFTLSSTDVSGQISSDQVFNSFGCSGKNISPQLSWTNAPEGTKSFAVTA
ncbi:MAG: YbhB/YbcL family Raf kinase inhibitor-like protein, partial [Gammaproteobacteria bacterium]|nr:YbhB/YbcL family Raf kinase inhibitor-like protein [Gammaproteobacteria bacterium]